MRGEVVEEGPTEALLADPRHPYTWALINAVPRLDRDTPGEKRLDDDRGHAARSAATGRKAAASPRAVRSASRKCDEHPQLLPVGAERRKARCWVTQAGQDLPRRTALRAAPVPREAPVVARRCTLRRRRTPMLEIARSRQAFPAAAGDAHSARQKVVHAVDGVDLDRMSRRDGRAGRRIGLRQVDAARGSSRASTSRLRARSRSRAARSPTPRRRRSGRCAAACRWCSRIRMRRSTRA